VEPEQLRRELHDRVADVTGLLEPQTVQARQMLRKLLADKIELEPVGSGQQRGYKFRGALTVDKLIGGDVFSLLARNTPDCGGPNGIRTRVSALRGPCPRPLDDGAAKKIWLGEEDSNPRYQGQNLASYP
jgi:hypothetical protein